MVAVGRHPGGRLDRLARAADRGRPGLAGPLLRPRLGRHPADRPGPATPRCGRCGVRDQRLRLGPPRERRGARRRVRARLDRRQRAAAGARLARRRSGSVIDGWRRSRARPAPGSSAALRADRPAWIIAAATGLVVARRPGRQRLVEDARRLGQRRLELERPAGPRRDRLEHLGRQLPAGGALLRRRAADLSLVRRLPRRDRLDRGRRRHHPGLLRHQRALRGGPRARRLGARDRA